MDMAVFRDRLDHEIRSIPDVRIRSHEDSSRRDRLEHDRRHGADRGDDPGRCPEAPCRLQENKVCRCIVQEGGKRPRDPEHLPWLIDAQCRAMRLKKDQCRDHGDKDAGEENSDPFDRIHGELVFLMNIRRRGMDRKLGSRKDQNDFYQSGIRENDLLKDRDPCPIGKERKGFRQEVIRHDTHDDEQDVEEILFAIDLDQRRIIMQLHIAWLTPGSQLFLEVMAIYEIEGNEKKDEIQHQDREEVKRPCERHTALEAHEKRRIAKRCEAAAHIRHKEDQEDHDMRLFLAPFIDTDQWTDEKHSRTRRADPACHDRTHEKDQRIDDRRPGKLAMDHNAARRRIQTIQKDNEGNEIEQDRFQETIDPFRNTISTREWYKEEERASERYPLRVLRPPQAIDQWDKGHCEQHDNEWDDAPKGKRLIHRLMKDFIRGNSWNRASGQKNAIENTLGKLGHGTSPSE